MSRSSASQKLHRIEAAEYLSQCHKTDDYKQYNGRNPNQKIRGLFLLFFRSLPALPVIPRRSGRLSIYRLFHHRRNRYFGNRFRSRLRSLNLLRQFYSRFRYRHFIHCLRYRHFVCCRYRHFGGRLFLCRLRYRFFSRLGHGCFRRCLCVRLGHGCFLYRLRSRLCTLRRLNRLQLFSTVCAEPESFTNFFSTIRTFCHVFSPFKQARTLPAFSPVL